MPALLAKENKTGKPKRAARGALAEQILSALDSAGHAGVRVKELAASLGSKSVNIHSWFHSALKRFPSIKKIKGGHYRLHGPAKSAKVANSEKPATSPRSAAAKPAKRGPARVSGKASSSPGKRRGALSDKVLGELAKAGSKGVSVREIADTIGAKYRNIYIWFATTGKKHPKVKKIGPALYKLA